MSVENSKSPVPASAAEQPAGATNKDGVPAAAAARDEPASVDAKEVAQKIASNASTEPAEKLAEGNHHPHHHISTHSRHQDIPLTKPPPCQPSQKRPTKPPATSLTLR